MPAVKLATKEKRENGVFFAFTGGHEINASINGLSSDIVARLAVHGLAQKIGDSYAGCGDGQEAYTEAARVWASLTKGNWGVERAAGEPTFGLLAQAIARVMNKPLDAVSAKLETMSKEQTAAIRARADVAAAIAAITAERKAAKAAASPQAALDF